MAQTALLVDCLKIINWLQDRHKLPKQWYNYQKAAEQKIKELLKDQQSYVEQQQLYKYIKQNNDNFHFCNIAALVPMLQKSKWAENKSLMFGYSDKRVKEWVKLKKFMESKQLHIINTAKFISQGLSFDLPSLDKNIELLDNQIKSLKRKIDMNNNSIFQQDKQEQNQRVRLKLDKDRAIEVSSQIPKLISQLPQLFHNLHELAKKLETVITKYQQFCDDNQEVALDILKYFVKNGNELVENYEGGNKCVSDEQKYQEFYNWCPHNQWGIQVEGVSLSKVEKNQTILENRKTRQLLVENLNQLLFFYKGILHEITLKVSGFNEESSLNMVESEAQQNIKLIQQILGKINGDIINRIQIKNNAKMYQIILKKFRTFTQNMVQMKEQNKQFAIQIQNMSIQREELVLQLRALRNILVSSKNSCEKYLTDFIKREIKIKGDINKLQ